MLSFFRLILTLEYLSFHNGNCFILGLAHSIIYCTKYYWQLHSQKIQVKQRRYRAFGGTFGRYEKRRRGIYQVLAYHHHRPCYWPKMRYMSICSKQSIFQTTVFQPYITKTKSVFSSSTPF